MELDGDRLYIFLLCKPQVIGPHGCVANVTNIEGEVATLDVLTRYVESDKHVFARALNGECAIRFTRIAFDGAGYVAP